MCNASSVPVYTAELLAAFIEAVVFGVMIPLVIRTLAKLERRRKEGRRKNTRTFQVITCVMVLFATWHFTIEWYRLVYVSIHFETSDEKAAWLTDGHGLTQRLKDFIYVFQTLTGDGILVYRCYLVWPDNKWVPVLPILIYLVSWGIGLAGPGYQAQSTNPNVNAGRLQQVILLFFVFSTITVMLSTSLILFKIWLTRRRLNSILFAPSVTIFLESGAVYCSILIVLVGLFISQCSPQIVLHDMLNPGIPILFCAVILALNESKDAGSNLTAINNGRSASRSLPTFNLFRSNQTRATTTYPSVLSSVHVHESIQLSETASRLQDSPMDKNIKLSLARSVEEISE